MKRTKHATKGNSTIPEFFKFFILLVFVFRNFNSKFTKHPRDKQDTIRIRSVPINKRAILIRNWEGRIKRVYRLTSLPVNQFLSFGLGACVRACLGACVGKYGTADELFDRLKENH